MRLIQDGAAVAPLSSIPVREGFRNSSPCSSKADQVSVFQTNVLGASITLIYRSPCTQTSTSCLFTLSFVPFALRLWIISYPHHIWCRQFLIRTTCGADKAFLNDIAWCCIVFDCIAWYCTVLHGIAW